MYDFIHSQIGPKLKGRLLKNEPLGAYSSWRTGGCADYIFLPAHVEDLAFFLQQLPEEVPLTWLGLGSNTLIRDGGLDGVVIITQGALKKLTAIQPYQIRAEAGVASAQLARFTARLGATGLEFMAGIPGTVGGALAMNAGCFGGETWHKVHQVETIDRKGQIYLRNLIDFQVGYRHVVGPEGEWFIAGIFSLTAGDKEKSLNEIRLLIEKRNTTQPTGTANCGSVFRNPAGHYAGRLIEQCGLKGKQIGGARVSEKHANFIINEGKATSADIEKLIAEVKSTVLQQTGVSLVPEVRIIGKETSEI